MITSCTQIHGIIFSLEITEERVLTFVTDQVREVAEWVRLELLHEVWQSPIDLDLIFILDGLISGDLTHVGTVEGHDWQ